MDLTEKRIDGEYKFKGRIINLRVDRALLPDGTVAGREVVEHNGGVCVAALTDDNEVLMVRQFRYPYSEVVLEIPAGKLDYAGEDRREAALRELREETGARCEALTPLGLYLGSPALIDEKIDLYLAEGLTFGERDLDEDEFLDVVKIPLANLVDMALRGEIPDGKTQLAVLKVWELLRRRKENA